MCFTHYYHPATILFPPQLKILYETLRLLMLCTHNNTDSNKTHNISGIALYCGDTCSKAVSQLFPNSSNSLWYKSASESILSNAYMCKMTKTSFWQFQLWVCGTLALMKHHEYSSRSCDGYN